MFKNIIDHHKKIKWEKADNYKRFIMVKDAAFSRCIGGYSYIVRAEIASRVIQLFNRLNEDGREFKNVLFGEEYLFAGCKMHNNLVVCFGVHFSIINYDYYKKRQEEIEFNYPRLRYVMVVDMHPIQNDAYKNLNMVYLKEYNSPEAVVKKLEEFTVDPKNCIIPTNGGGI